MTPISFDASAHPSQDIYSCNAFKYRDFTFAQPETLVEFPKRLNICNSSSFVIQPSVKNVMQQVITVVSHEKPLESQGPGKKEALMKEP